MQLTARQIDYIITSAIVDFRPRPLVLRFISKRVFLILKQHYCLVSVALTWISFNLITINASFLHSYFYLSILHRITMIKKQNLDRILLRITIISDRFNILGKKRYPLTIKQPQTFGFNYLRKNILLIYIIILRKRCSKVGSNQKNQKKINICSCKKCSIGL